MIYFAILIILNIFILVSFNFISDQFRIEDKGDGIRKFQKKPISLLGGTLILVNILVIIALGNLILIWQRREEINKIRL